MENLSVYKLDDKLEAIKIPKNAVSLSPIQKQVLALVNRTGQTSVSEIFVKTGLGFGEVNGVLGSLAKQGLVAVKGKDVHSNSGGLNLSRMAFTDRPRFMHLPNTEVLKPELEEMTIIRFVQSTGVQVTGKRVAYMPFYKVETSSGTKQVDAMSYSLTTNN